MATTARGHIEKLPSGSFRVHVYAGIDPVTGKPRRLKHLNTVAGRLGHAEGSTTLKFYAQFTRPADQQAAAIIPASLDGLRKKERLRELYRQSPAADLEDLAASLGPAAGLDHQTALAWLAELTASG